MKKDLTEGSQHQIDILNRSIENNQALIKEIVWLIKNLIQVWSNQH